MTKKSLIKEFPKKFIKESYNVLSKEIKWWENKEFIDELDNRYSAWEKGYTFAEVDLLFEIAKKKRKPG